MPPTSSTESRTTSTIRFIFVFSIYNLLLFRRKKRPKAIKTLSIPRFVFSGISHLWRYALHFVSPIVQRSIVPLRQHSHYFPVDIPFLARRSQIDIKTFRLSLVCLFFCQCSAIYMNTRHPKRNRNAETMCLNRVRTKRRERQTKTLKTMTAKARIETNNNNNKGNNEK